MQSMLNSTAKVHVFAKECFFLQKTITPAPKNSLILVPRLSDILSWISNNTEMKKLFFILLTALAFASCSRNAQHIDYVLFWKGDGIGVSVALATPADTVVFSYASENGGMTDQMTWFQDLNIEKGKVLIDTSSLELTVTLSLNTEKPDSRMSFDARCPPITARPAVACGTSSAPTSTMRCCSRGRKICLPCLPMTTRHPFRSLGSRCPIIPFSASIMPERERSVLKGMCVTLHGRSSQATLC